MKCIFNSCHEAIEYATERKSFGVFYSEHSKPSLQMHVHNCCEIFLCLSDGNTFLIDGKVYDVKKGDLFILNPFQTHKVSPVCNETFVRFSLHVHPTYLFENSASDTNLAECFYRDGKLDKISLTEAEAKELTALFRSLEKDYGYGEDFYKNLRVCEILLLVNKLCHLHSGEKERTLTHQTLQLAIDYVNAHFHEELTLETIAKNAYVSVNQLCRLFHQYCSTTVTKYIIGKRISHAKKLLSEGKSVTETAFACGFNDYANFIRAFKNAVGVPPGKYKTQLQP